MKRLSLLIATLLSLAGCATSAPQAPSFILLGEVHDNALHHEARAAYLRELLKDGKPTTIVYEQMGRAQDAAISAAPRETQAVIEAGKLDQKNWRWPLHKPLIDASLAGGAAIKGGNLERDEVRRVVREGEAVLPADVAALIKLTPWSDAQQQTLIKSIDDGHCGALPKSMYAGMSLAQRSRDAVMAQAMLNARKAGAQRVVLIAGNGHVRRDLAVPLYLQAAGVPAAEILSIGYLEATGDAVPYDQVQRTAAAEREDPCKALMKR